MSDIQNNISALFLFVCFKPLSCDSICLPEVLFVHLNVSTDKVSDSSEDRTHHQRDTDLKRRGKSEDSLSCLTGDGVSSSSEGRFRSVKPKEILKNIIGSLIESAKGDTWTKYQSRKVFFPPLNLNLKVERQAN